MSLNEFVPWYRNLEARLWSQQRGQHAAPEHEQHSSVSVSEERSAAGSVRHHVDVPNWPQHSTALISVAAVPPASADDEYHATMQRVLAAARAAQEASDGVLPSRRHVLPKEHSLVLPGVEPRADALARPQEYDLAQFVSRSVRPAGLKDKVQELR